MSFPLNQYGKLNGIIPALNNTSYVHVEQELEPHVDDAEHDVEPLEAAVSGNAVTSSSSTTENCKSNSNSSRSCVTSFCIDFSPLYTKTQLYFTIFSIICQFNFN
ncbi:hypothetical protein [Streptococcus pantholopis]